MKQLPAKSTAKKDIVYIGDFLHIEKRKFHGRQKFPDVVRMISI